MTIDYLIIGQGLCGTFLSYYLQNEGKQVLVIDENKPFTASKVASGVINPVTGRRIVRTWRIEELMPFARQAYTDIGNNVEAKLVTECRILDFHASMQMKEAFDKRLIEEAEYLHKTTSPDWVKHFNYYFGAGEISPCLLIDINLMLNKRREKLQQQNCLIEETFDLSNCRINDECITYNGISAQKIIFCDGVAGAENPFFKNLPYALNKGEVIIAKIPGLPTTHIYKQGFSIVPWKDDFFWIGSSYDWNYTDIKPSAVFKEKVIKQLTFWLKLPFEIIDHFASVRPANMERRPFVGLHPKFKNVGILNGMGTKGCSLAPFFAKQLADYLVHQKLIYADADVKRFEKILSRKMN